MPEPLDYVELGKAARKLLENLGLSASYCRDREKVLLALTAIAKRALEQAARVECDELVIGKSTSHHPFFAPAIRLSDACAALNAPKETPDV